LHSHFLKKLNQLQEFIQNKNENKYITTEPNKKVSKSKSCFSCYCGKNTGSTLENLQYKVLKSAENLYYEHKSIFLANEKYKEIWPDDEKIIFWKLLNLSQQIVFFRHI